MKHIILFIVFILLLANPAKAQITYKRESFPKIGDTLFIAVDNLPSNIPITPAGPDQRWDFTNLQAPFARRLVVRPASDGDAYAGYRSADQLINQVDGIETYYRLTSERMNLVGFYGADPLGLGARLMMKYSREVPERRAPLRYRENFEAESNLSVSFSTDQLPRQVLDRLPITPDSLRIRIRIQRTDNIDAWGMLTIPGGIYDVLRERRVEVRTTRLDAKLGFLPWQDITDLVPQLSQLGELKTVTYLFFSNEAKEPIAIVYMDGEEKNTLRVEFKASELTTSVQNVNALRPNVYAYPNPAIVNVRFEFTNLPAGDYTLTVYNILGVEQWSRRYFISGNRTERINVADLRRGTYLYSLKNARGKTITTKRLIVIKP